MFYVIIIVGLLSLANVSTSYAAPPSSSSSLRSKHHHHHSSRSKKKGTPVEMIPNDEMEGGAGSLQDLAAAVVVGHEEEEVSGEDLNHSDVDADHHKQSSNNGQSNIVNEDKETVHPGSYTTSSVNSNQDLVAAVVVGHEEEEVSGEDLNHSDVDADHHNQSSNNGQSNTNEDKETVHHGSYTTSSVNSNAGETSNTEYHAQDAISTTNYQQTNDHLSEEEEIFASGAGASNSPGMGGSDISNEKPLGLVTTVVDLLPEYKAPMAAAVVLLGVSVAIFAISAKKRRKRRTVPSLVLEDDFDDTTNTTETVVTDYVLSPVAMGVTKEGIASIFRSKQEVFVNKDLSQVARTASIFRKMLGDESTTSASESGKFYQPSDHDIEANDSIASSIWPDDDEEEGTTPQVGSASLQVVGTSSPRVDTTSSSRGTQIKRMCEPLAAIILLGLATIVTSNGGRQEDEIPRSMV
jgi:hypothetical protein